jgi:hypothetical protein
MSGLVQGSLGLVSSILGIGAPSAPAVKPPAVMPTVDDAAVEQAKQRRIAEMQSRSGRASTIFTGQDSGDKVGG